MTARRLGASTPTRKKSGLVFYHIWLEYNLVNFKISEDLYIVLRLGFTSYFKTGLGFAPTRNVPFWNTYFSKNTDNYTS